VSQRHEETVGTVAASTTELFAHLDDQTRLSEHMSKRSWKLGWGKMAIETDAQGGRAVGSHIVLSGRVFGVRLFLEGVVTERDAPRRKRWRTLGEPRLLVIGAYEMGFELEPSGPASELRVTIDYELPTHGMSRILGKLFAGMYAQWCTRQMVRDAHAAFSR
jgi:hypothetical protein